MTAQSPPMPEPPFRLWPFLAINALASCLLALSQFQELQSSDSLIFVLGSLYEWRPFFWEQERIGMLVPLLMIWCKSPLTNLLLQSGVMMWVGLSMPVILARVLTPNRLAPVAVTLGNALFLLMAPDSLRENWFLVCNYPSALFLGLLAISLSDSLRRDQSTIVWGLLLLLTWFLLLLAHWQYFAVIIFLGLLIVLRAWLGTGPNATKLASIRRLLAPIYDFRALRMIPGIWLAFGLIWWFMQYTAEHDPIIDPTSAAGNPVEIWPDVWGKLVSTTLDLPGMAQYMKVLVCIATLGFGFGIWRDRQALGRLILAMFPALIASTFELLLLGTREWTVTNECHPRYLVTFTTSFLMLLGLVGVVPWLSMIPRRWESRTVWLSGVVLVASILMGYGLPSVSKVKQILSDKGDMLTPMVLETGCEAVGGDYWDVWPMMFHINMTLHDRGEHRVVFGVSYRCDPMSTYWNQYPEGFRIALPLEDAPHVISPGVRRGLDGFELLENRGVVLFPANPVAHPRRLEVGILKARPDPKQ